MPIYDQGASFSTAFSGKQIEFQASDVDEAANPRYYGFLSIDGKWLIRQLNTATGAIRYAKGSKNYSTNWTNRASLSYSYYSEVF